MRVAVIPVDLRLIRHVAAESTPSYWDGDVWIETERRYDLSLVREALCLPESWHLVQAPHRAMWVDPIWGRLLIAIESESFPEVPYGENPPHLHAVFLSAYDEATGQYVPHFDHFNMSEVESLRSRVEVAQS